MAVIAVDEETKRLIDEMYDLLKRVNGHTRSSIARAAILLWRKKNQALLDKLRQRQVDVETDQDLQALLASLDSATEETHEDG